MGATGLTWVSFQTYEHQRLLHLFDRLQDAFRANAREDIEHLWDDLETALTGHLMVEERHIFPKLGVEHPSEVAALIDDHEQIRQQLAALGVAVDLHELRDDLAEEFLGSMRRRAEREDQLMSVWADAHQIPVTPTAAKAQASAGR
jgi:hemerythrin-like domain-containing protein